MKKLVPVVNISGSQVTVALADTATTLRNLDTTRIGL